MTLPRRRIPGSRLVGRSVGWSDAGTATASERPSFYFRQSHRDRDRGAQVTWKEVRVFGVCHLNEQISKVSNTWPTTHQTREGPSDSE